MTCITRRFCKPWAIVALALVVFFSAPLRGALAAETLVHTSGRSSITKMSLDEQRSTLDTLSQKLVDPEDIWSVQPDVDAYVPGVLSDSSLELTGGYLNLVRHVAGLGDVTLTPQLNESAAAGALLLAKTDTIDHYPNTPAGMSDEDVASGKYACSTSNLTAGYNQVAILGLMNDDGVGNSTDVGHRRWILHPHTKTMGLGTALGAGKNSYKTLLRVMGAGVETERCNDFDFIAWPPSGDFLPELMNYPGASWSITVNPIKYQLTSNVSVTVERLIDGAVWTLDRNDGKYTGYGEFFNVDTAGYGIANCIVFTPGTDNLGKGLLLGSYRVVVKGLQKIDGSAVTIDYTVRFSDDGTSHDITGPDLSRDGWVDLAGGEKGYARGGKLVTGWMDLGSAKYYFQPDGSMSVGWNDVVVDGKVMHYYFNPASGNLVRDTWFTIGETNYYFRPSGNLATGWASIKDAGVDKKYYFRDDGSLVNGTWYDVVNDDGVTNHYYFRPSGAMATGWATIGEQKYFFRPSGNMATGFADVDDAYKRYFDNRGIMLTGWQEIGPNTYYFRPSGAMQTGAATIDGKSYTFSDKGVLISEDPQQGKSSDGTIGLGRVSASAGEGETWTRRFVAPRSGIYTFASEGEDDVMGALYEASVYDLGEDERYYFNWNDDEDYGAGLLNFRMVCELDAGEEVVLEVAAFNRLPFSCDVVVYESSFSLQS